MKMILFSLTIYIHVYVAYTQVHSLQDITAVMTAPYVHTLIGTIKGFAPYECVSYLKAVLAATLMYVRSYIVHSAKL